jgi:hypothetical protein
METLLYLLIASVSLSLFYLAYQLVFRNDTRFMQQRIFLLAAAGISLLVPLLPQRIELGLSLAAWLQSPAGSALKGPAGSGVPMLADLFTGDNPATARLPGWLSLSGMIWLSVSLILILRIGIMLVLMILRASQAVPNGIYRIVRENRQAGPYSFFGIIFIPSRLTDPLEEDQVIAHEKIHVQQWHSADRLGFELLAAVMWFNPLIWKMKQSLTLVHEYLADEGALKSGIDRVYYQALLVNQVAGAPLIPLSSRFNHSLLKKRILMMTQTKTPRTSRFRILAIAPLTIGMLVVAACLNGLFAQPGTPETGTAKPDSTITVKKSGTQTSLEKANILYYVDGKETPAEKVNAMDPNTIESMNVIKDKEMIKKYTDKKVEGVILITLKAKAK